MKREAIEARVKALESAVFECLDLTIAQKRVFEHIAVWLRDLALEVEELHPEELSLEDTRAYIEEDKQMEDRIKRDIATRRERDKLAEKLIDTILNDQGVHSVESIDLATQLKVKFDATKER